MQAPAPADVQQALWRDIEPAPIGELAGDARVSVVVDGDPDALRGALAEQTYPAALIDVAEWGERPQGDVVVVVPPDLAPAPAFVEAHVRWHLAVADAVSLGPVCPRSGPDDSGLSLVRDLTRDLTDLAGGHHLAAADGTFAARAELLGEAGGPGDAPAGLRRLDLLFRLHCAGAVFVAEPDALAHGDPGELAPTVARACEAGKSLELVLPAAAGLVGLPPFREAAPARRHQRPAVVVNLDADQADPAGVAGTIANALQGELGDLELRVQADASQPGHDVIAAAVAADDRALLAPSSLDEPCASPFQITLPAAAALDPRTLADLHELALGEEAGALHVTVPGAAPEDAMIEVLSTAAWRRARRMARASGGGVEGIIGRLFGERWISGVEVSTRRHGVDEPQVTEHGPLAAATDLGHERNAHLRFRERAEDLAERAAFLAERTLQERLAARKERRVAQSAEARLRP